MNGALESNPYNDELFLYEPWKPKVLFQFEIILNGLVPPFPNLIFFLKHLENMKTTQKKQKKQNLQKNSSSGLTHPPISEFFSDFWIFLTWQNPLIWYNRIIVMIHSMYIKVIKIDIDNGF